MATPRLKEKYVNEVRDQLFKELGLTNVNQIPRLEKIVINMGVGRAAGDKKLLDGAIADRHCRTEGRDDPRQEVHRRLPSA